MKRPLTAAALGLAALVAPPLTPDARACTCDTWSSTLEWPEEDVGPLPTDSPLVVAGPAPAGSLSLEGPNGASVALSGEAYQPQMICNPSLQVVRPATPLAPGTAYTLVDHEGATPITFTTGTGTFPPAAPPTLSARLFRALDVGVSTCNLGEGSHRAVAFVEVTGASQPLVLTLGVVGGTEQDGDAFFAPGNGTFALVGTTDTTAACVQIDAHLLDGSTVPVATLCREERCATGPEAYDLTQYLDPASQLSQWEALPPNSCPVAPLLEDSDGCAGGRPTPWLPGLLLGVVAFVRSRGLATRASRR